MFHKKFDKQLMGLLMVLLVACLSICSVQGRPSETMTTTEAKKQLPVDPSDYPGNLPPETILKVQQCEMDQTTMELCMRCAKVTKSEIIYPMCCNNDDSVKDWCHAYVYYGNDEGY
ncbi:uncharacterized protein LOC6559295 [Drosophila grimshawi]|nr:uncharacterized protein LOC6559295 [Drosophila grimshawi]